ncbi:MAG: helix-turn-helix transcriptional regulator [Actinomycetota bacterium]|jgi:DNA-binding XRE family transcriptional regulator|nr:helix-turn-helix transcriptional regulator [Ilumatobacteraceae bacterium]MCX6531156.1 helix-turn-helix transcriptional regulator [Actinomycetota bacterium]MDA2954615.1 helix-turn-helix transcriptional regulator [Actinomycetota bacterium]
MVISQRTLKVKSSLQQEVVADQLRKQRIKAEFSQDELAKLAGIDRKTINRIENGHFSPTLDTITRLCVVLKITPGNLLGSGRSTRK